MTDQDKAIAALTDEIEMLKRDNKRLTRERDEARRDARQAQQEVSLQQRTAKVVSDGLPSFFEGFQSQMRELIAENFNLQEAIDIYYRGSSESYDKAWKDLEPLILEAGEAIQGKRVSHLAVILLNTAISVKGEIEEEIAIHKTGLALLPDAYEKIYHAGRLNTLEAGLRYAIKVVKKAWLYATDPRYAADQILRECRRDERKPSLWALQLLPIEFLKTFPGKPPAKYETLRDGLETAQRHKDGLPPTADGTLINERWLRNLVGWYDYLDDLRRQITPMPRYDENGAVLEPNI